MKPLRSLWVGERLGIYERAALLSLARFGYDVGLFTYRQDLKAPGEIALLNANEIVPETEIFHTASSPGTFSGFSNLFRYRMLRARDEIWVDTDIIAGSASIPELPYVFGRESKNRLNGAVLGAPKDSSFLLRLDRVASEADPEKLKWGEIGPKLITQVASQEGLLPKALDQTAFYPVTFRDTWKFFSPERRGEIEEKVSSSFVIHLWNEVMRRASRPVKEGWPHPDSFLGRWFADLEIRNPGQGIIDPEWVEQVWRNEEGARWTRRLHFLRGVRK